MERYDLSVANVTGQLPEGASKEQGISLAIGFFDGVHLGHLEVVRQAVSLARRQGLVPAVLFTAVAIMMWFYKLDKIVLDIRKDKENQTISQS